MPFNHGMLSAGEGEMGKRGIETIEQAEDYEDVKSV